MIKFSSIFLLTIIISIGAFAQDYTSIHYDISFPMGNTSGRVAKTSFRGVGIDYRKGVNSHLGFGFSLGWHAFYEPRDKATYTTIIEGKTYQITGVQYNYINAVPLHVNLNYHFGSTASKLRPYLAIGIGATSFEQKINMGIFSETRHAWQFSIQPEAGILFKISPWTSALLSTKYIKGFDASDLNGQSYLSLNLGIARSLK